MAKTEQLSSTPTRATVARRKSVDIDGILYGPGEPVTLPANEVASLIAKGFLVDPDADDVVVANDGPSIGNGAD